MKTKPRKAQSGAAGDALPLSAERFKCHLEISSEWYWEQDENYRFTLVTGAGFDETGSDPRQYIGTKRWDHGAVPAGDNGTWETHKAVLEARQPFADFVFKRVDAQGEQRYISTSGQPLFDGKQQFKGYRGIGKDITALVRAEQLLRLEHLVARCLSEADSASAALKAVIRAICETQRWECGRYFGWNDKAGALVFNEFWHVPNAALDIFIAKSRELIYAPGAGLVGQVLETGQPLWVTDLAKDTRAKAGIARDAGMKPELLEIELAESTVMRNQERATKVLRAIKQMGVRISLADFGAGYALLARIKHYPIDTLKVDRSFIRGLEGNLEDRAITEAIIAMGKTLSLTVVAEGVETEEQQAFLSDHACDAMQGFYFSKPITHEKFASFLRQHLGSSARII